MPLMTYMTSHSDVTVLEKITTGREHLALIETLVQAVRDEIGRTVHQHQLVVGPRGAGKTHVLTITVKRLRSDPDLRDKVFPVVFAEEEVVGRPADLLVRVIERLVTTLESDPTPPEGAQPVLELCRDVLDRLRSEKDDEATLVRASDALLRAAKGMDRLIVPVVENLDALLYAGPGASRGGALQAHWGLREVLQKHEGLMFIAAAPTLFAEAKKGEAPFYDFFRPHFLQELSPDECVELIGRRLEIEVKNDACEPTRKVRMTKLNEDFPEREPHLRSLLIFTGGLPRFCHLLFDLLCETDPSGVTKELERFLDAQTPYFQQRLDPRLLPQAELDVLEALAMASGPLTPTRIAEQIRGGKPNAVNTTLKRLLTRGLVRKRGKDKRAVLYDVAEPLYRVWRRFRLGRTEQEQIRMLAEFVATIYRPDELLQERQSLQSDPRFGFRLKIVDEALKWHERKTTQMQKSVEKSEKKGLFSPEVRELINRAEEEFMTGSLIKAYKLYSDAIRKIREEKDEKSLARKLGRYSYIVLLAGDLKTALESAEEGQNLAAQLGDDLGQAECIQSLGDVLFRMGQNAEAMDAYEKAEKLCKKVGSVHGRANCIYSRGDVLFRLGQNQEALDAYEQAEKLYQKVGYDRGQANCIQARGEVLFDLGQNVEALDAYEKAEKLFQKVGDDLGRAYCIQSRGNVLSDLGQNQEALAAYDQAEKLFQKVGYDLGRAGCLFGRGRVFYAQDEIENGLRLILDAFEICLKQGHRYNTELCVRNALERFFEQAAKAGPGGRGDLAKILRPLFSAVEDNDAVRTALIESVRNFFSKKGAEALLRVLPVLEENLPASRLELLRPARLAAEVKTKKRAADLPDQPEEMRRAVAELLKVVSKTRKKS